MDSRVRELERQVYYMKLVIAAIIGTISHYAWTGEWW